MNFIILILTQVTDILSVLLLGDDAIPCLYEATPRLIVFSDFKM